MTGRSKFVRFTLARNNPQSLGEAAQIASALESVVRGERLRIVAALASHCGDLDLAEEAFAEACCRALEQDCPPTIWAAWLYRVSRNVLIDRVRRVSTADRFSRDLMMEESELPASPIPDQRLALVFACCHPAIAATSRVALALTTICGLTAAQVASAFLVAPSAMSQRLLRAKQKLAGSGILFEIPDARFWAERLDAVLATIEIAFARGHADASGKSVDAAFAAQTLELIDLLSEMLPGNSEVHALAANLYFSQARRPARVDAQGQMVPLSLQDPAQWSPEVLQQARRHFALINDADRSGSRAIQAELQSLWCSRESSSDPAPWAAVLAAYDRLLAVEDTPFVRLNRAVAVGKVHGARAALAAVSEVDKNIMRNHPVYHAVRAGLLTRCGTASETKAEYDLAIAAQDNPVERDWLRARRRELRQTPALRIDTSGHN